MRFKTLILSGILIVIGFIPGIIFAQQIDSLQTQPADSLQKVLKTDSVATDVVPVSFRKGISYQEPVSEITDSLMRWHIYSNLSELLSTHYPAQTYQMDGFMRQSQLHPDGADFKNMAVLLDGFTLNSPMNGQIHQAKIPYMRIAQWKLYPQSQRLEMYKREYYKLKPVTHVTVDQSSYGYNSVGGHLVLPVNKKVSTEVGIWNRGYKGEYQNSETSGIQLYAQMRVQSDSLERFRAGWQYDVIRQQQPDGYAVADMNNFSFNRFVATPLNSNAYSSEREHRLYAVYETQRNNFDLKLGGFLTKNRRFFYGVDDSVQVGNNYQVSRVDSSYITFFDAGGLLTTGYTFSFGSVRLRSQPNFMVISEDRFNQFGKKSLYSLPVEASTQLGNESLSISLDGGVSIQPTGIEQFVMAESHQSFGRFQLHTFAGAELKQQDAQLSWFESDDWKGNNLDGVFQSWFGGRFSFDGFGNHEVSVRYSPVWHQLGVVGDTFNWANERQRLNATYRYRDGTDLFEWNLMSSVTFATQTELGNAQRNGRVRQYHSGSFFYKDFWFNSAAFVKIGIQGESAPTFYYADRYLPQFDRYLTDLSTRAVPGWYRVNAEMSARIRQMIVYIKAENLQQGSLTNGHFEIAEYPQFSRRFRFGLRVIFIN